MLVPRPDGTVAACGPSIPTKTLFRRGQFFLTHACWCRVHARVVVRPPGPAAALAVPSSSCIEALLPGAAAAGTSRETPSFEPPFVPVCDSESAPPATTAPLSHRSRAARFNSMSQAQVAGSHGGNDRHPDCSHEMPVVVNLNILIKVGSIKKYVTFQDISHARPHAEITMHRSKFKPKKKKEYCRARSL